MHICILYVDYLPTYLPTYLPDHFSSVQNIINDKQNQEFAYNDEAKCYLLNKYFSFISKLANAALPDIELKTIYNISDFNVSKTFLT